MNIPASTHSNRVVYIAHPFRGTPNTAWGDPARNLARYLNICSEAVRQGYVPLVWCGPDIGFAWGTQEPVSAETALSACFALVQRADEVWLAGPASMSRGMQAEIQVAEAHGIPIIDLGLNDFDDVPTDGFLALPCLVQEAHGVARSKGWWANSRSVPELLALVHAEVSEALEAYRVRGLESWDENGKPEGVAAELGDVILRILDMCGGLNLDIGRALSRKLAYNRTRSHRHGGKRC